jgi:small subunit ribosomal protein S21
LNRSKGRQGNKTFTKNYNSDRKQKFQKKEEHYLDAFNPSIEVRNGDVNKAIRVLKKRLEKSDFQKELAKQQYYEKPSETRKRKKAQAKKRWQKQVRDGIMSGQMRPYEVTGQKYLKSKRKTRKMNDQREMMRRMQRDRGYFA